MTKAQYSFLSFLKNGRTVKEVYKKFRISYEQFVERCSEEQIQDLLEFSIKEPYESSFLLVTTVGVEALEKYESDRQKRLLEWISILIATIALIKSFWQDILKITISILQKS